ncbi:MAG TPA: hypothetical protein VII69_12220 [Candidatus Eremiobacteraceae bacterium]
MIRGALAAVVWSAAFLFSGLCARADACSDTWFYSALAATGERDLSQYMGEGGTQTAKSDFDIVARNMDLAGRTVDACKQADTIAKFAFTDADRWQIGFDRGWIPAPDAARHVHGALTRLKAIHFDSRDPKEYNSVQIHDKALFKAAGLAWEAVR